MDFSSLSTSHAAIVSGTPEAPGTNLSFNQFLAMSSPGLITNISLDLDQDCVDKMWNLDVSDPTASLWPCARASPDIRKRRVPHHHRPSFPYRFSHALSISATYEEDGNGYNITLPGHLCANTVVGNFVSPAGNFYPNATMALIHNSLAHLSPMALLTYTQRRLKIAENRLYDALKPFICDPPLGGARALLARYEARDRSGECCWAILNGLTVPIYAGTFYIVLAQPAFAQHWPGSVNWGIGVFGFTLLATWQWIIHRLERRELALRQSEADILNFFIIVGEYITAIAKASWGGVCATTAMLWEQMAGFCETTRQPGLQAPGPDPNADPGHLQQIVIHDICPEPEPGNPGSP
ncbi:MAG: hypothetical protein LQ338_002223 [Usnochroma carphineum]|nr:MAG: hypothetical protein LQ338_002223 [Usnochroma carphineum]